MKQNNKKLSEPWFKHDFNASSDMKLLKLRRKYGIEVIGIYWMFVELLYRQNGQATMDDLETEIYDKRIPENKAKAVINMCFNTSSDGIITCARIDNAIKEREELSETRAKAAKKRYEKRVVPLPDWMDENGNVKEYKPKPKDEENPLSDEESENLKKQLFGDD